MNEGQTHRIIQQTSKKGCFLRYIARDKVACIVEHNRSFIYRTNGSKSWGLVKTRNSYFVRGERVVANTKDSEWGLPMINRRFSLLKDVCMRCEIIPQKRGNLS